MPSPAADILDVDTEPATSVEKGRRPSFKLPAPLNTSDDILDRNVWSPSRRNSSIVANSELRSSNSPRTTQQMLLSQGSGGSGLGSPKPVTPTKFEDPLLSMPSFRRSGNSPTLEPTGSGSTGGNGPIMSPAALSPSFRALSSNSFSARGSHIDFRRSVPGGSNVTSPGEAAMIGRPSSARQPSLTRGTSDFGNHLDLLGYASSVAGSESGGPGLDDDEAIDTESDTAAAGHVTGLSPRSTTVATGVGIGIGGGGSAFTPIRHHSAFAAHSLGASSRHSYTSSAARLQARPSEDDEFMVRLQQNRTSWRERPRAGSYGPVGLSFGGSLAPCEGLQNQTHAALQQLRGEFKSLSVRSMRSSAAASVTAAASAAALPLGAAAAAIGGGSGGGGHPAVAGVGSGSVGSSAGGSSGGGGDFGAFGRGGLSGGASGGGLGPPIGVYGRHSEGHAQQLSPSRLSVSYRHYYNSGDEGGAGGSGGGCPTKPELFPFYQISPPSSDLEAQAALEATGATGAAVQSEHTRSRGCARDGDGGQVETKCSGTGTK
ncbi:hypothetical protein VaNZ11_009957 [Volvox africanus]|uniref:Uncharacterized protein n=1 Tax=Volvox africanus TaxID=51714 RepID=A0ABQ5S8E9_9CHLO|nr:hypothetical protein VaNZ11_009957 [Volvox africanus]